MRPVSRAKHSAVAISMLGAVLIPAFAFAAPPVAEHDRSHATAPSSSQGSDVGAMAAMQDMHAMHQKLMAAKTPAERQALVADHMRAMQAGMQAMQQMRSSAHGSSKSMAMRMDMMTMMMQMMMDRQQIMGSAGMSGMMGHPPAAAPAPGTPSPPPTPKP